MTKYVCFVLNKKKYNFSKYLRFFVFVDSLKENLHARVMELTGSVSPEKR